MAKFDYRCDKCRIVFEVKRKFGTKGGDVECPKCGAKASQLFDAMPPVHLFGQGWTTKHHHSNPSGRKQARKLWDQARPPE